jgi:two-component system OmpR family response regulator
MPKLLLVDDDEVLRTILVTLLRRTGHEVVEAATSAAAFALATGQPFDLAILDVMMPDFDGYELARRLRVHPATRALPILLVTASLHGPDPDLARRAGADAIDMKTANVGRLNEKINALLALRQAFPLSTGEG